MTFAVVAILMWLLLTIGGAVLFTQWMGAASSVIFVTLSIVIFTLVMSRRNQI